MAKEKVNKHPDWRLSSKERMYYYMADIGRLFGFGTFSLYMTPFLALRGVNLSVLAGIMLILKIIDAVDDIIFGYIIDRLKITEIKAFKKITGDGKYLPWYRLTFTLFAIFTMAFYLMPANIPQTQKMIWFIVTYLLYDFSCTLAETPMNSLIMTLTDNTEERNHILMVKGIITVISAVFLGVILNLLVDPINGPGLSFTQVAIGLMIACIIVMVPMAIKGKEYNTSLKNAENKENETYTLRDMWNCVKVNKFMMIFLISSLITGVTATASSVSSLISFYLFNGNTMILSLPVLIAFIPAMILNTKADKIAEKLGRRNSLVILGVVFGAMNIIQYLVGYKNIVLLIILGVIAGIANSVRAIFMNFIAPDTIEYTRYKTGKDCSGIFYALNSFVTKAVGSVGASLGLLIMSLYHWNPVQAESFEELLAMGIQAGQAAYQSPLAIHGMWVVYALIPGIGYLLSALVMWFYKLKDKDAELMAKCNAGEITREECETMLSGKY